jgi:hypothetical protein
MSFEFQSCAYRTSGAMHLAVAGAWLSANGANNRETMAEFLRDMTDEELALEAELGWELADNPNYDRKELAKAFSDLREYLSGQFPRGEDA